ncbi:MAG TPA: DUF1080 domain-containing protein [Segetibacter sp.]|nr:DUF1080 domain-containing protein [Segetibacter sp.]
MKQRVVAIGVVIFSLVVSSYTYMAAKDNTLTPSEIKTGWKLLFDGKSLKGWRSYQNQVTNSWTVNNGVMYCKGSETDKSDKRADMITEKEYENFDLSIDWKISPQGNSGILYMVTEEFPRSYQSGPEYQIIDDLHFPQKLEDWQKTGANYAMDPAPTAAPNPVGQWNTTRIVVNNGHVQHWLNGKKLLDFQMWTDEWKKKKMEGKWKDAPGYGMSKKGHIGLQDHGSEAWFKNLKIKEL